MTSTGVLADLECPICCLVFRDPRTLPCSHSLCMACILRCMKNHEDGLSLECPCRCQTFVFKDFEAIKDLQKNRNLANICLNVRKKAFEAPQGVAPDIEKACDSCSTLDDIGFCDTCGAFLCSKCMPMRDHALCCTPSDTSSGTVHGVPTFYPSHISQAQAEAKFRECWMESKLAGAPHVLRIRSSYEQCHIVKITGTCKFGNVKFEKEYIIVVHPSKALDPFNSLIEHDCHLPSIPKPNVDMPSPFEHVLNELKTLDRQLHSIKTHKEFLQYQKELQKRYQYHLSEQLLQLGKLQAIRKAQVQVLKLLKDYSDAVEQRQSIVDDEEELKALKEEHSKSADKIKDQLVYLLQQEDEILLKESFHQKEIDILCASMKEATARFSCSVPTRGATAPREYNEDDKERAEILCKKLFYSDHRDLNVLGRRLRDYDLQYKHSLVHNTDDNVASRDDVQFHYLPFFLGEFIIDGKDGGDGNSKPKRDSKDINRKQDHEEGEGNSNKTATSETQTEIVFKFCVNGQNGDVYFQTPTADKPLASLTRKDYAVGAATALFAYAAYKRSKWWGVGAALGLSWVWYRKRAVKPTANSK